MFNGVKPIEEWARPYQREAVEKVLSTKIGGFLFAMGLGKSYASLLWASKLYQAGEIDTVWIIAPGAILRDAWLPDIDKFLHLPHTSHLLETKTTHKYNEALDAFAGTRDSIRFLLCPLELMRGHGKAKRGEGNPLNPVLLNALTKVLRSPTKYAIVMDESSNLKNPKASQTRNILKYCQNTKYKVILTGTDTNKSPLDLFGQFEFLRSDFWETGQKTLAQRWWSFQNRYGVMQKKRVAAGREILQVVDYQNTDDLKRRIAPYIYRATKETHAPELPEKIWQKITVHPTKEQKEMFSMLKNAYIALYKGMEIDAKTGATVFGKLRQITDGSFPAVKELTEGDQVIRLPDPHPLDKNPKLDALLEDLETHDEQAIIWCNYTLVADVIRRSLIAKYGQGSVVMYTGQVDKDERQANVEKLRERKARFMVANPQSAGVGLNLQFVYVNYYFSRPLSPFSFWQSQDRTHRIGSKKPVLYKDIVMTGSVDTRVLKLLEQSQDIRDYMKAQGCHTLGQFLQSLEK